MDKAYTDLKSTEEVLKLKFGWESILREVSVGTRALTFFYNYCLCHDIAESLPFHCRHDGDNSDPIIEEQVDNPQEIS